MKLHIIWLSFFFLLFLVFQLNNEGLAQVDSAKIKYLEMSLEEILNMEVTTALKSPGKFSEVPATIHLITHEQIASRGYSNLQEVLEDIPEIELQKKSSAEYGNYFTMRGVYGSEKFIIMMDGTRINSPTGTPLPISYNYPVADAKQIEVILGPASALYGVDAFTGIINIITFNGSEQKGISLSTSYGMYNTTNNSIVAGGSHKDISFSFSGNFYHSDEPDFPSLFPDLYQWYNQTYKKTGEVLLPDNTIKQIRVYDYSTPTQSYAVHAKLNIKGFEAGYFRNYESHCSSFSVKPEYSIYSANAKFGEWVESMYISHNHELDNKKWKFYTSLSYSKDEIDPKSNYMNSFTSFERGYKYAYNKSLKFEEQLTFRPFENISVIAGFSYQDFAALPKSCDLPFAYDRSNAASLQNMYYIGTNVTDSLGRDLTILQDFYFLQYQNYGMYIQSHINFLKSLSVTLGARYDYNTRYKSSINPRLGIVYAPVKKMKFKLLYGKAFFAPSPYSAYQHYGSFVPVKDSASSEISGLTAGFWRLPNEDLKSQTVSTYETSCVFFLNEDIVVSLNGFYNDLRNLLSSQGYTGQSFHGIQVNYIERPINKVTANTFGGTCSIKMKFDLKPVNLNTYLAYTYIDGDIEGKQLPFSAKHTLKGGIDMQRNKLHISGRVLWRSKSYHRSLTDENGNRIYSEPYAVVNLTTRYTILKRKTCSLAAFVKILNVLDTKYYNLAIGGSECFRNVPQDPIHASIGLNFRML